MRSASENLARAVIYDPVTQNLRATRYGLYEAGFRDIEGYNEFSELRGRVAASPLDLLIAEAGEGGDIYALVSALRKGQMANNPFAVVFVTTWRRDAEAVSTALRSGADDIIVRPFSSSFIEARVRSAVENRKQFVVTSDYLGPDRRRGADRGTEGGVRLFHPPNTLKSAVTGDRRELEALAVEIEAFKDIVRRERAVRLAIKIGVEIQLAVEGQRPSSAVYALSRELFVAVESVDPEAAKLAAAMVRALSAGDDVQKAFRLANELAMAVCVLCGGEADERKFSSEIENLLGNIRTRGPKAA